MLGVTLGCTKLAESITIRLVNVWHLNDHIRFKRRPNTYEHSISYTQTLVILVQIQWIDGSYHGCSDLAKILIQWSESKLTRTRGVGGRRGVGVGSGGYNQQAYHLYNLMLMDDKYI